MLDLEDAVPPQQKDSARRSIRETIPLVSRGGAEVFVRVNHDPGLPPVMGPFATVVQTGA